MQGGSVSLSPSLTGALGPPQTMALKVSADPVRWIVLMSGWLDGQGEKFKWEEARNELTKEWHKDSDNKRVRGRQADKL